MTIDRLDAKSRTRSQLKNVQKECFYRLNLDLQKCRRACTPGLQIFRCRNGLALFQVVGDVGLHGGEAADVGGVDLLLLEL